MSQLTSREIRLISRPDGEPTPQNFELAHVTYDDPSPGMVQVRNYWMSVDPYMRGRMYDRPSYVPPFGLGETLQGHAIGEVIASGDTDFAVGDIVTHMLGWREIAQGPKALFTKVDTHGIALQAFLGVMGMPGMTAYCGFLEICTPKAGETVFVSGAAGAVGSLVCQIAKLKGCNVVASCGSEAKAAWLKSVGVDEVINYKTAPNLLKAVQSCAHQGIDMYFDNVGGEHLEVALEVARVGARFAECGMISQYNATRPTSGPKNLINVIGKSLKIQGFIVSNFAHLHAQFVEEMGGWIKSGDIKWEETIMTGIDKAPAAFIGLFNGVNAGKMLVKLS
ncbi:NADP-dependent oxidoreductase [Candidatus Phycosocius spiralis]|uniref:NADP-dependent oxidoreductase n=1 Tax=Candidatus Phycosocius spiralis TaxID=2815099 RepID=A0ABQ4PS43_9PROT|nr:NADP-dependent oxidoreductase [Candidatus Phycosocius spiralis]GIU65848.1 NADP-dependent oxidoreductase [Candidatus Phycosocius spiralis]